MQSLAKLEYEISNSANAVNGLERISVDARGKKQYVYADLESIYPYGVGEKTVEFCFEELRARRRGWSDKSWSAIPPRPAQSLAKQKEVESTCHLNLLDPEAPKVPEVKKAVPVEQPLVDLSDENQPLSMGPPRTIPLKGSPDAAARRAKREEKANKTRKIKIVQVEIKQEAQTSKWTFSDRLFMRQY
jgi:checkpoint serine/threonine-protein kinase